METPRQTITRRSDEPKLEIGDTLKMKDGVIGVVIARYSHADVEPEAIHYIMELRPDDKEKSE